MTWSDNLATLASQPVVQQLAPLVVVVLIPIIVLSAHQHVLGIFDAVLEAARMVLETLGLNFLWNRSSSSHGSRDSASERKKIKKKPRTRAEQVVQNGSVARQSTGGDFHYYPGLVNISGTYCFMDSTLQAMASLCYLQPYLNAIHAKAEALDVPTPIVDALCDLLRILNTPTSSPSSLRPHAIIQALATSKPAKQRSLFATREHQDAQELFQLISECIKEEALAVDREGRRDRGLSALALAKDGDLIGREVGRSVFEGLTANRRSCMQCGYTEAVMHFGFDNWQLALPPPTAGGGACRVEDCIAEYTKLEVLTDCVCRRCSMVATHRKLVQEVERLSVVVHSDEKATKSARKRAREARKLEARVRAALEEGRIEDDIDGVKMEKVISGPSTKQAMVARPPPILALHLNRSIHYGYYAGRNNTHVIFPEILDLTPFTTSGSLSTNPTYPISSAPSSSSSSSSPSRPRTPPPRTLYRLSAVVCHYGDHSYGHYVCYRKTPRPPSAGSKRAYGLIRESDDVITANEKAGLPGQPGLPGTGCGWLRISDDDVREVGIETVLSEGRGAFMIYYERVLVPVPAPAPPSALPSVPTHAAHQRSLEDAKLQPIALPQARAQFPHRPVETTPRSSEETIKPPTPTPPRPQAPDFAGYGDAGSTSAGSAHTHVHMPPGSAMRTPTVVASSNLQSITNRAIMNGTMARPTPPSSPSTSPTPALTSGVVYPNAHPLIPLHPPPLRAGSLPRVVRNVSLSQARSRAGSPANPSGVSTPPRRTASPVEMGSEYRMHNGAGPSPGTANGRPRAGSRTSHMTHESVQQPPSRTERRPLPIPPPQSTYTTGAMLSPSPALSQLSQRPRALSNTTQSQAQGRTLPPPPRKQSIVSTTPPAVHAQ
ncbi:cysteine proteinase [Punctularia strigosozonata HHB-11173 SS5]|uniref:cysteine proteinase n=1 Tax=Punctularia strigosozonata (strain HHB-11173) TaxID=741275 RepID=UPI0004416D85|nr:cysteine proteinase [Punctularia strigosozonata HHB-11173 SS5]EIN11055.1 cysteine proteinase [Punctularia strigosozonata HHB-11173 SS5]